MRGALAGWGAAALAAACVQSEAQTSARGKHPPVTANTRKSVAVARLDVLAGSVETAPAKRGWARARDGARLQTGDRVRTAADGLALLDLAWSRVLLDAGTTLTLSLPGVLSTQLEQGRIEQWGEADIVTLRTPEALLRGRGRVVVRRDGSLTRVAALEGRFQIETPQGGVTLEAGKGTRIAAGSAPESPQPLPEPPAGVSPGSDPAYVVLGRSAVLSWSPSGAAHHLQVVGLDGEVLTSRDVGPAPLEVPMRWLGTFRWRVSTRDERGLEGPPSREGWVCVVEK